MKVLVFNQQSDLPILKRSVKPVVEHILSLKKRLTDEVAVYFVSTPEICRLHETFFQDPSPTDCISFPMDDETEEDYHFLGEIFICPQTAIEYTHSKKKEVNEVYEELTLYLVHGLLHLLGYDDIDDKDRKIMKREEKKMMRSLIQSKKILF